MTRRILRVGIPAAAAAAVLLAVGLWPETASHNGAGTPSRAYALADIPALLASAKVLHLHEWFYVPNVEHGSPDSKRRKIGADYWLDTINGRWRIWYTDLGLTDGTPPSREDDEMTYRFRREVSDGEYVMELCYDQPVFQEEAPLKKWGEFTRQTPLVRKLNLRDYYPWVTAFAEDFSDAIVLGRYAKVGEETLDGVVFEIWQREYDLSRRDKVTGERICDGLVRGKTRVWLSPTSGAVGRWECWRNGPSTDGRWQLNGVTDQIECDVEPPPGIFETVAPPEFRMRNTKETAPLLSRRTECDTYAFGDLEARLHFFFLFDDGTLLLAWSSWDTSIADSQAPLFEDLTPGGPLPNLPIEIQAFVADHPDCGQVYTGRHLAWTQKDGRCYEWSLYVQPRKLMSARERCPAPWDLRYVVNSENPTAAERHPMRGPSSTYVLPNAAEFNELVPDAMADLSDDGGVPEYVTYDYVMQLSDQVRASLPEP